MLLMSCSIFESEQHKDAILLDGVLVTASGPITKTINELMNTMSVEIMTAYEMHAKIDTIMINQKIQEGISQIDFYMMVMISTKEVDPKINYKQSAIDYSNACTAILLDDFSGLVDKIKLKNINDDEMVIIGNRIIVIWGKMLEIEEQMKKTEQEFALKYDIDKSQDTWGFEKRQQAYKKAKAKLMKARN